MVNESINVFIDCSEVFSILSLSWELTKVDINCINALLNPFSITFSLLKLSSKGSVISISVTLNIFAFKDVGKKKIYK